MPKRKRIVGAAQQEVNMTPMIDCTFQLIIFFILTAQMASQELPALVLPQPVRSQAFKGEEGNDPIAALPKITVNVVNKYGKDVEGRNPELASRASAYHIRTSETPVLPGNIEQLTNLIKKQMASMVEDGFKKKEIHVEIRADADVAFQDIEPVMKAAAEAGITKMSMTALVDPDNPVTIGK